MDKIRRGLLKTVAFLGGKRLIKPLSTAKALHFITLGKFPDLKNPTDFNEKLLWLEYNTDTREISRLSDKYEVREYVRSKGLESILVPLVGVYDSPDEINTEELPQRFVIKTNNGSAQTMMVYDKNSFDIEKTRKKLKKWLRTPFGHVGGEKHYIDIRPRVIIEEMIGCEHEDFLVDYKFMCFNGEVHSCLICTERDPQTLHCQINLMDVDSWREIHDSAPDHSRGNPSKIARPRKMDEMLYIARRLSEGFPFVRVDLYESGDKVYFGELTFTPAAFRIDYFTPPMLREMGNLIEIKR